MKTDFSKILRLCPIALAMASVFPAYAQEDADDDHASHLSPIVVHAAGATGSATGNSAQLLDTHPGYFSATGGGVAGIPIVNGLGDDRLKIRVDGMDLTAACANHMNTPLSYAAPSLIGSIRLNAGVTPVSLGGDNIGGSIEVKSPAPAFASADESLHTEGRLSAAGRSVDHSQSIGLDATVASSWLSLSYAGSQDRGQSYRDGNGDTVLASMYKSENHRLTMAARDDDQQLVLRLGEQRIPYQGFPNQYMDMTGNHAQFANATYTRDTAWARLEGKVYWQETRHEMGFFSTERTGMMPMSTQGQNLGYTLQAEIPTGSDDALWRIGNEFHRFTLDDWWPPVAGSMMMGPNNYVNINDGKRDRFALFAEYETTWRDGWSGIFGLRDELVRTDAGPVQPYGSGMMQMADVAAAAAFNARDRARTDNNIDLSAIARYEPDERARYEFGIARKSRSPSLYERYTWGRGSMAMTMTNWFGDGNGYVGDMDLKPEVANTLSFNADWHDAEQTEWYATLSPYFSYVQNYIDADVIGTFSPYSVAEASGKLLRFANHDAMLYGLNATGGMPLLRDSAWGDIDLGGSASYVRGKRTDGNNLYRMAPLTLSLALSQRIGAWTQSVEARMVAAKRTLDAQRNEIRTAGYTLVNLRTEYRWDDRLTISAGITNLFDKAYSDPMGGVYLSGLKAQRSGPLTALPGYGRSFDIAASIRF
ncbi:MAG: TonB-dependent receptor [Rhodocyclaceae bacterium]